MLNVNFQSEREFYESLQFGDNTPAEREQMRAKIKSEIDQFLAKGGEITKLETGKIKERDEDVRYSWGNDALRPAK